MKIIRKIIDFGIILIVGHHLQEETMDMLYPNRPKGLIRNLIYDKQKCKEESSQ